MSVYRPSVAGSAIKSPGFCSGILIRHNVIKAKNLFGICGGELREDYGDNYKLSTYYYEFFRCLLKGFGVLDLATYAVKQEEFSQLLSNSSKIESESDRQFVDNASKCLHYDCIARNCNITKNPELSAPQDVLPEVDPQ